MTTVPPNRPQVLFNRWLVSLERLGALGATGVAAATSYGLHVVGELAPHSAAAIFVATTGLCLATALLLRAGLTRWHTRRTDLVLQAAGMRYEHCLQFVTSRVDRWRGTGASGRRLRVEVFRSGPHVGLVRVRADLGRRAMPGVIDGTRSGMSWRGSMTGQVLAWPQARVAARTLVSGHRRRRIVLRDDEVLFEIVGPAQRVGPHDVRQWVDAADKLAGIVRWVAFEHEAQAETMVAPVSLQSIRELRIAAAYG